MSDSDMPIGGDMGGRFTEQMIDELRRKDYFKRLDRVLTGIEGNYSEIDRLKKELVVAKALACQLLESIEAHEIAIAKSDKWPRKADYKLWDARK